MEGAVPCGGELAHDLPVLQVSNLVSPYVASVVLQIYKMYYPCISLCMCVTYVYV